MTCNVCLTKRKEDTIVMDCPVCMEDFKKSKMTETKCGNGHFLCNGCYEKMSGMTTDYGRKYTCPMSRNTQIDNMINIYKKIELFYFYFKINNN